MRNLTSTNLTFSNTADVVSLTFYDCSQIKVMDIWRFRQIYSFTDLEAVGISADRLQKVCVYLGTVCVSYAQHIRVVLGEKFGSASTTDTQLLITKNSPICGFYSLRRKEKVEFTEMTGSFPCEVKHLFSFCTLGEMWLVLWTGGVTLLLLVHALVSTRRRQSPSSQTHHSVTWRRTTQLTWDCALSDVTAQWMTVRLGNFSSKTLDGCSSTANSSSVLDTFTRGHVQAQIQILPRVRDDVTWSPLPPVYSWSRPWRGDLQ